MTERHLTERQQRVWRFVAAYAWAHGRTPSYGEIGRHLGIDRSTATEHVDACCRNGVLAAGLGGPIHLVVRPPNLGVLRPRPRPHPPAPPAPPCAHCADTRTRVRRHGLCHRCYQDRSVRELHAPPPNGGAFARDVGVPPPPDAATDAAPGSEAKLAVMAARAAAGRQVFAAGDVRLEVPTYLGRRPPRGEGSVGAMP